MEEIVPAPRDPLLNLGDLFRVPDSIKDTDIQLIGAEMASRIKTELVEVNASMALVMEGSLIFQSYVKHMQTTRKPYMEVGGYMDPGQERVAFASLSGAVQAYQNSVARARAAMAAAKRAAADEPEKVEAIKHAAIGAMTATLRMLKQRAGAEIMVEARDIMVREFEAAGIT